MCLGASRSYYDTSATGVSAVVGEEEHQQWRNGGKIKSNVLVDAIMQIYLEWRVVSCARLLVKNTNNGGNCMGFAYKITDQQGIYFVTATVVQWIDVFTRQDYNEIVLGSLRYCQEQKGLCIYGWVIMSNHLHMIISCKEGYKLSDTIRDFKKFTSTKIVAAIEQNPQESRRNWLLWLLKDKDGIAFWLPGNHPEELRTMDFFTQKLYYMHNNPVKAGIVDKEEDYIYSSARDFYNKKGLLILTTF